MILQKARPLEVKLRIHLKLFRSHENHGHFFSLTNLTYLREKRENFRKTEENGYTKTKKSSEYVQETLNLDISLKQIQNN